MLGRLRTLIIAACILAVAGASFVPVASAHATHAQQPLYNPYTCSGQIRQNASIPTREAYCDHLDPTSAGGACGTGFTTLDSENFTDHGGFVWQVQIRYSSACESRWARLQAITRSGACMGNAYLAISRIQRDNTTDSLGGTSQTLCDGAYTNMLYSPNNGDNSWQTKAMINDTICGGAGYATWVPTSYPNDNYDNGYDYC